MTPLRQETQKARGGTAAPELRGDTPSVPAQYSPDAVLILGLRASRRCDSCPANWEKLFWTSPFLPQVAYALVALSETLFGSSMSSGFESDDAALPDQTPLLGDNLSCRAPFQMGTPLRRSGEMRSSLKLKKCPRRQQKSVRLPI